ncbi:MAG TPA: XdhC family protein [Steroidobacteraceae bacterium]|nr:XdhC family protein [Steroidobacteraceae bacterium]HRX88591.1 XdhC family protein [Steroidobacteraceae bacterium]
MTTTPIHRLLPLLERCRLRNEATVLATVLQTAGSTYAKPGEHMLIAPSGEYAGLLSGGCLEGDLRERAVGVRTTGLATIVSYDMRSSDDQLFGLGSGCEGAMDILLTRVGPQENWEPLGSLARAYRAELPAVTAFVTESDDPSVPLGWHALEMPAASPMLANGQELAPWSIALRAAMRAATTVTRRQASATWFQHEQPRLRALLVPLQLPPRLLVAGAGPDTRPVVELAAFLAWRVSVVDHRAAYADPARFALGAEVIELRPEELASRMQLDRFDAAVIMSHHLDADRTYLAALAGTRVPYIGLLGPPSRRARLLRDIGSAADLLATRLRAPVGLDLGGRAPESIALAIIAEIHAALAERDARPYARDLDAP